MPNGLVFGCTTLFAWVNFHNLVKEYERPCGAAKEVGGDCNGDVIIYDFDEPSARFEPGAPEASTVGWPPALPRRGLAGRWQQWITAAARLPA